MKKLLTILFILFSFATSAQTGGIYQTQNGYGFQYKHFKVDSTLHVPTFCGVPTLRGSVIGNQGALAIDSCNKKLYFYDPKDSTWNIVTGGKNIYAGYLLQFINDSTLAVDTASLFDVALRRIDSINVAQLNGDTINRKYLPEIPITIDNQGDGTTMLRGSNDTLYSRNIQAGTNITFVRNSDSSLTINSSGGMKEVIQTYTGASSVIVTDSTTWLIINPSSLSAAMSITMPANPSQGQQVLISFGGTIISGDVVTSLTILANTGQNIIQVSTPSSVEAGESIKYKYEQVNKIWYRI